MKKKVSSLLATLLVFCFAMGCIRLTAKALPSGQALFDDDFEFESNATVEQSLKEETTRVRVENQLQSKFEDDVDEMIRIQDDVERSVAVKSQNLENKKNLTKKEKETLKNSYREMPKTVEEYNKMSRDIKRKDRKVAEPKPMHDDKLVEVPEPRYVIKYYNDPPGTRNIDLRNLKRLRQVRSEGVVSPQKDKMVYTTVYYAGMSDKVSSEVFLLDLDTTIPLKSRIKDVSLMNKTQLKLLETGLKEDYPTLFKTLTVLDWSKDGKKIAIKERIGSSTFGIWKTNLWVYDLEEQKSKQLVEVREAVKYWWKEDKKVNIDDYRWDILPLGWDAENPDRIFVAAYAYTNKKALKLLGNFSIDIDGTRTKVVSFTPSDLPIETNGLVLCAVND